MLHPLAAILTIALCVYAALLIHELGHFWCARLFGLEVSAIAIGFGPALLAASVQGTPIFVNAFPFKASVNYKVGETGATAFACRKIAVSLSGPLASLSAALLLGSVYCALYPAGDDDLFGLYRRYGHFPGIPFLFYWFYHLIAHGGAGVLAAFAAMNFLIFCNGMLPIVEHDFGKSIFNLINLYDPQLEGKAVYSYLLLSGGGKHLLHLTVLSLSIMDLYRLVL